MAERAVAALMDELHAVLEALPRRIVACSGGVDSLLLATVAHRAAPEATVVAHAVTPAVPGAATGRTAAVAAAEGWDLQIVHPGEFDDERYLSNPVDRCYSCKSHLYDTLGALAVALGHRQGWSVLSGANLDDLSDYRPGLAAAAECGVRHPLVEAGIAKVHVRAMARALGLDFAAIAASPCLASRLYTGTRVTPARLQAIDAGEELVRRATGIEVVRCRLRDEVVLVEVPEDRRRAVTPALLAQVRELMRSTEPTIHDVRLDDRPYRQGQAVLAVTSS